MMEETAKQTAVAVDVVRGHRHEYVDITRAVRNEMAQGKDRAILLGLADFCEEILAPLHDDAAIMAECVSTARADVCDHIQYARLRNDMMSLTDGASRHLRPFYEMILCVYCPDALPCAVEQTVISYANALEQMIPMPCAGSAAPFIRYGIAHDEAMPVMFAALARYGVALNMTGYTRSGHHSVRSVIAHSTAPVGDTKVCHQEQPTKE